MHTARSSAMLLAAALGASGCYHYSFEQRSDELTRQHISLRKPEVVRYKVRKPTWINGFVGTGEVDTARYCERPVRTELRVTATDVLISIGTLLVYTPHTLYVTCPVRERPGRVAGDRLPHLAQR